MQKLIQINMQSLTAAQIDPFPVPNHLQCLSNFIYAAWNEGSATTAYWRSSLWLSISNGLMFKVDPNWILCLLWAHQSHDCIIHPAGWLERQGGASSRYAPFVEVSSASILSKLSRIYQMNDSIISISTFLLFDSTASNKLVINISWSCR